MEYEGQDLVLLEEINLLISFQQEGGYWDFKKQWYEKEKKSELLHDIICMANNLYNRDAYIIIGVDEENDCSIVDVKDDNNRKNTQMLVDFLKDKKFAGGIRPLVHVERIPLESGDIDVIVIENSHYTPFYLTERYENVRANHIYTRIMDTNTPIDKSADINHVESLWRKRFHLDESPIEKFRYYLSAPQEWEPIQNCDMGFFFKYSPEYTVICESDELTTGYEYYIFGQVNTNPHWWLITLKYHQTAIEQYQGLSLDGGRCFVVAPDRGYDLNKSGITPVGYYVRGDLKSHLLEFFHQKEAVEEHPYRQFMNAIIEFNSKHECVMFFEYIKRNISIYRAFCEYQGDDGLPFFPDLKGRNMDEYKREYRDALVLKKMLNNFRARC